MFKGVSSLRAGEKKEQPQSEKAKAMQAYLAAQYGGGEGAEGDKKKKKKKKRPEAGGAGLKILDQDVSGFAAAAAAARRAPPAGLALGGRGDEPEEEDEEAEEGEGKCLCQQHWENCEVILRARIIIAGRPRCSVASHAASHAHRSSPPLLTSHCTCRRPCDCQRGGGRAVEAAGSAGEAVFQEAGGWQWLGGD